MITKDDTILQEKRAEFEEDFILAEDPKAELQIMKLLSSHTDNVCFALLKLRWCVMLGSTLSWEPDQSPCEKAIKRLLHEKGAGQEFLYSRRNLASLSFHFLFVEP